MATPIVVKMSVRLNLMVRTPVYRSTLRSTIVVLDVLQRDTDIR